MISPTTLKGELACLKLEERALAKGAVVSRPTLECHYDRIVDWNGRLWRVQVKYADSDAPHSTGALQITIGKAGVTKGSHVPYAENEIDALAVYIARTNTICWFEQGEWLGKVRLQVRYEPAKNNQTKGCRMAGDFEW